MRFNFKFFSTLTSVAFFSSCSLNTSGLVNLSSGNNSTPINILDGQVTALAAAIDGSETLYLGGEFKKFGSLSSPSIIRLDVEGHADANFSVGGGFDAGVNTLAIAHDGSNKVFAGGSFNHYNGLSVSGIARLNVDGSLDSGFVSPLLAGSVVNSVIVGADQKSVYVAGDFVLANLPLVHGVLRLGASGLNDSTFNVTFGATVRALALASDGGVYAGGDFQNLIAQVSLAGVVSPTYLLKGSLGSIKALAYNSGALLVGGAIKISNSSASIPLLRMNSLGMIDPSFSPAIGGSAATVYAVRVATDGSNTIYVGGDSLADQSGNALGGIARLNADASLDTTFVSLKKLSSAVLAIEYGNVQPVGEMYLGGSFSSYNGNPTNEIARLNADGTLDLSFTQ